VDPADDLLALPLGELLARLASDAPSPAGGALAAIAAAGAAAMVEMGASLTIGRVRYAAVHEEMAEVRARAAELRMALVRLVADDADAYTGVLEALRLPDDERPAALDLAALAAAGPPRRIVEAAAAVAELAARVAEVGNVNLVGDAMTAAVISEAAGRAATSLVEIDTGMSRAPGAVTTLVAARADSVRAAEARTRALAAADMRRPRARPR
jgi:formiminotetrahydrofolate cyclodeaminase